MKDSGTLQHGGILPLAVETGYAEHRHLHGAGFSSSSQRRRLLRYAIYLTPAQSDPLTLAAAQWLGRNAFTGEALQQPAAEGILRETLWQATAEPRRYGFHATIKAPFELKDGVSEPQLLAALADFASARAAFTIPSLRLVRFGPFFALHEAQASEPLQEFADAAVRHFEPLRAPLSHADIARRKPEQLPEKLRKNLLDWGYPHVFEDFRFHMTLTGALEPELADALVPAISAHFAAFEGKPLRVDTVALFMEPERGAPFTVHTILPLAGEVSE